MLEHKLEFKKLDAKNINWILKYAYAVTSKKNLQDAFKYVNISFAIRINKVVQSIVVMIVGEGKHYVVLLWTNNSHRAIKDVALYFRDLAKKSTILFHSQSNIARNHRTNVSGAVTGKSYFKAVV